MRRTGRAKISVCLSTPLRRIFSGKADTVEISPANGTMQMERGESTYFGLVSTAEITVRLRNRHRSFNAIHAAIGIDDRKVTVLAETIREVTPAVPNCANPVCRCGAADIRPE